MLRLLEDCQGFDVRFDQCMFGLAFVKPTQIRTNLPALRALDQKRCNHPRGSHAPMEGIAEAIQDRENVWGRYAQLGIRRKEKFVECPKMESGRSWK